MQQIILPELYHKPAKWLLIAMYIAGIIGLAIPFSRALFLALTPFHLVATTLLVLAAHPLPNARFWFFCLLIAVAGYTLEWFGVHTGKIFGSYQYGSGLGWKVSSIPPLIGINWLLLIYCTGTFMQSLFKSAIVRILAGSLLLVLLDLLIEPVAPKLDFWEFLGGMPTILNFIGWYVSCCVFLLLFNFSFDKFINRFTFWVILLQFVFFTALNILI